jgi:hypothetical protein
MEEMKNPHKVLVGNVKEIVNLKEVEVDGMIT